MAQTKISQLTELSTIADNDYLAGVDTSASTTKKVKMSALKSYINTGDAQDVRINNTSIVSGNVANIAVEGTYNASTNKIATMSELPTKTSELTNDSNFEVNTNKTTTIDSSSTDIQYPSAKATYDYTESKAEDLENQLAKTQSELDTYKTIYNALPKVTDTNERITLEDTAESPLKTDLYGNTDQTTTSISGGDEYDSPSPDHPQPINVVSGDNVIHSYKKNMLNIPDGTYTEGDVTIVAKDGVLTINGTTTAQTDVTIISNVIIPINGVFTLVRNNTTDTDNSYPTMLLTLDGTETNMQSSSSHRDYQTFNRKKATRLRIRIPANTTYTNVVIKPMMYMGAYSSLIQFEPYQGKVYTINLGTNLFDKDTAVKDDAHYRDDSGTLRTSTNMGYVSTYTSVKPNTTYTIKISSNSCRIYYLDINKDWISRTSSTQLSPYTFTTPSNCYYIQFQYSIDSFDLSSVVIQEGNSASYVPYGKTPIELCKIGDYQDYIYKDNGKWYKYGMIGKIVLDGTEQWTLRTDITIPDDKIVFRNYDYVKDSRYTETGITNVYCNYFIPVVNYDLARMSSGLRIVNTNHMGETFFMLKSICGDASAFQTWLSTHNTIVYYVLATPTITEITNTTLINQLEDLRNAMSYQEQTNINQVNSDLPFIIKATALKDISTLEARVTLLED